MNWATVMVMNWAETASWVVGWAAVNWAGWWHEKIEREGCEKTERENKVSPGFNNRSK